MLTEPKASEAGMEKSKHFAHKQNRKNWNHWFAGQKLGEIIKRMHNRKSETATNICQQKKHGNDGCRDAEMMSRKLKNSA